MWLLLFLMLLVLQPYVILSKTSTKTFLLPSGIQTPSYFDIVTLSLHASCVTSLSIQRLNEFFNIRDIHVVTKSQESCKQFLSQAANVQCHLEHELVPGLSYQSVKAQLLNRFQGSADEETAASRVGWYLQQLLKLGSALALRQLTDYYMIWDLDMIPLKSFNIFSDAQPGANAPFSTRLDISSIRIREYETSYRTLFAAPAEYPSSDMSFVAHWVMVYKPFMLEMLSELNSSGGSLQWMASILSSISPGYRNVYFGFSEYTTYISWVRQRKPGTTVVEPQKAWMRVAPLNHMWLKNVQYDKCCPDERLLRLATQQGWAYLGWELGGTHSPQCKGELGADGELDTPA